MSQIWVKWLLLERERLFDGLLATEDALSAFGQYPFMSYRFPISV